MGLPRSQIGSPPSTVILVEGGYLGTSDDPFRRDGKLPGFPAAPRMTPNEGSLVIPDSSNNFFVPMANLRQLALIFRFVDM
jgi:hypothetical protein